MQIETAHEILPAVMNSWIETSASALEAELSRRPWTIVEFWAPDCLFGRLLAPSKKMLLQRFAARCDLLRCQVRGDEENCLAWGVSALPVLVLFDRGRWKKRWIGDVHPILIARALDPLLPPEGAAEHEAS